MPKAPTVVSAWAALEVVFARAVAAWEVEVWVCEVEAAVLWE